MSNKDIAVNWAINTVKLAASQNKIVISSKFFKPFSNKVRKALCDELRIKFNIYAWAMTKNGAILCYVTDPHLTIKNDGKHQAGVWVNQQSAEIIAFPAIPLN